MGKYLVLLIVAISFPLGAGTVSVLAWSPLPVLPPGNTTCTQVSIGPASCHIEAIFVDPRTGANSVSVRAEIDFGSISGLAHVAGGDGPVVASYQSTFGDYVTVLGASGQGTLVTHYHLISVFGADWIPGHAVPPSYGFAQGKVAVEYTPVPGTDQTTTLAEDLDVSSPVTFGSLVPLTGRTKVTLDGSYHTRPGYALFTSSSAQITGFTVLDSNGSTLANAVVSRSFSATPPDPFVQEPFVPEPSTMATTFAGAALICSVCVHRRAKNEHAGWSQQVPHLLAFRP